MRAAATSPTTATDYGHGSGERGSSHAETDPTAAAGPAPSAIDARLADARAMLHRLTPREAEAVAAEGGLLVDIRPAAQRAAEGEIPDALVIERNVLEWRLDPTSAARIPEAAPDRRVVVFCQQGYTSSLAAASLKTLGLPGATDLDGGFEAWRDAGLPTTDTSTPDARTRTAP